MPIVMAGRLSWRADGHGGRLFSVAQQGCSGDGFAGQPAGAAGHGPGMAALHRTELGAEMAVAAIHQHPFAMPPLIAEPQPQLEVVLGAAGDFISTDRPDTDPGSCSCRHGDNSKVEP